MTAGQIAAILTLIVTGGVALLVGAPQPYRWFVAGGVCWLLAAVYGWLVRRRGLR